MECQNCWVCGIPTIDYEKHHLIPKQAGGLNIDDNLVILCKPCHDFIDRHRFMNTIDIEWFLKEINKDPGPRWAKLLLLETQKLLSWKNHENQH